ncbi:MAG: hypothetical protein ACOX6T_07345 [Myxococcales bacterium]
MLGEDDSTKPALEPGGRRAAHVLHDALGQSAELLPQLPRLLQLAPRHAERGLIQAFRKAARHADRPFPARRTRDRPADRPFPTPKSRDRRFNVSFNRS